MNAQHVAEYLRFKEKTIRNGTSEGTIPYEKVGGSPRCLIPEVDEALKTGPLSGHSSYNAKSKKGKKKA